MSSVAPALIGVFLFLQLAAIRFLAWADSSHVWVLGRELHWGCWFKEHFGIPCPTCGMTRSVILTLHGHLGQAIVLNAGGPGLVASLALFGVLMFFQASAGQSQQAGRKKALWMISFGWVLALVIMGQWIMKLIG